MNNLIQELRDYFDDRADGDYTSLGVVGNEEMRLLSLVDEIDYEINWIEDERNRHMEQVKILLTQRDELREVLADLVFQCEDVPTICTDRAKATLDGAK